MKKVLFVCNYKPGVGGISGQVEALQNHLQEEGYLADIFSTRGCLLQRLLKPLQLRRLANDYDVLHIHCCSCWGFLPAVIGISVGRRTGKRIVLTYHGGGAEQFFHKHAGLVRRVLSRTDANIVLSGFLAKVFDRYNIPYTVIPNIVELDTSRYRERKPLAPKFICTRSHEAVYDIPCILRAFRRVLEQIPEASLTLVGDGTLHDSLIHQAEEMHLKNVSFTGRVDNKQIYELLDKSDVFVSASTVDNMPVSILEAMNAGLFVIASKVGGVPYMVEDGATGELFEIGNDKALADLMLHAISHQEKSRKLVVEAKARMEQYTWESIRSSLLPLYE